MTWTGATVSEGDALDFIDSIRLGTPVTLTNFHDGLLYMRVTEAITRSRLEGRAVDISEV